MVTSNSKQYIYIKAVPKKGWAQRKKLGVVRNPFLNSYDGHL